MAFVKQKCPSCGRMVEIIVTDRTKKGMLNACKFCAAKPPRTLKELNEERKQQELQKGRKKKR